MIKESKVFTTEDGKEFKTKSGAENHMKKLEIEKALKRTGKTAEELLSELKRIAPRNMNVRVFLDKKGDWKNWPVHLIAKIDNSLFAEPLKRTVYIIPGEYFSKNKNILETVEKEEFENPEAFCGDTWKVDKVVDVDELTKEVYYDYAKPWDKRILEKIKSGKKLTENELRMLVFSGLDVHEEENGEGRWSAYMTTVLDLNRELYAVEWQRGLTEMQPNEFYEQPYAVKIEKKEVIVKTIETSIIRL